MFDLDLLQQVLLDLPETSLGMPFGPSALVFKVLEKRVYAIVQWQETPLRLSLKCKPDHVLYLCDVYQGIVPGYHLNKRHWITITLDGSVPEYEIRARIRESYDLVCAGLTLRDRRILGRLAANSD